MIGLSLRLVSGWWLVLYLTEHSVISCNVCTFGSTYSVNSQQSASEHNPSRYLGGALQARTRDGFMVGERNGGLNIVENRDGDGFVDLPPLAML